MVRCGSKNGHHKNMCIDEIGLHVQNMLIILGSLVNMIFFFGGGVYDHLMSMIFFHLDKIRYLYELCKL